MRSVVRFGAGLLLLLLTLISLPYFLANSAVGAVRGADMPHLIAAGLRTESDSSERLQERVSVARNVIRMRGGDSRLGIEEALRKTPDVKNIVVKLDRSHQDSVFSNVLISFDYRRYKIVIIVATALLSAVNPFSSDVAGVDRIVIVGPRTVVLRDEVAVTSFLLDVAANKGITVIDNQPP